MFVECFRNYTTELRHIFVHCMLPVAVARSIILDVLVTDPVMTWHFTEFKSCYTVLKCAYQCYQRIFWCTFLLHLKLEGAQRVHISAKIGLGMEMGWGERWVAWGRWLMHCGRDTHCWRLDWMHRHTHRHTLLKTAYPPVSLRSLGGYNYDKLCGQFALYDGVLCFVNKIVKVG